MNAVIFCPGNNEIQTGIKKPGKKSALYARPKKIIFIFEELYLYLKSYFLALGRSNYEIVLTQSDV